MSGERSMWASKNGGREDPRRAQLRFGSQSDDGNCENDTVSGSASGAFVDVLLYYTLPTTASDSVQCVQYL